MVTSSTHFHLLLFHAHLHLLQITNVDLASIRNFETELNRLLGGKHATSHYLTVCSVVLATVWEQPRRVIDILVRMLVSKLVTLHFDWVVLPAQCSNAPSLSACRTFLRFFHMICTD